MRTEEYWNNKWKKSDVIYKGRGFKVFKRYPMDVRCFLRSNPDMLLEKIIKENSLKCDDYDMTMLSIQQWVVENIKYKHDFATHFCAEFWQFPFETIYSKEGDCEDGAILIANLALLCGVPSYRIKVAVGDVDDTEYIKKSNKGKPTKGLHAYCLYLANDDEWRIIDWCWYQDSYLVPKRKPLSKNGGQLNTYKDVKFTFSEKYIWSNEEIDLDELTINKEE